MKVQFSLAKSVVAGISGTIIMTLFTYMGALMNIKMDIPAMLSTMFGGSLLIGWIMYFMIGIVLGISYGLIFYSRININPTWTSGAVFAILPWMMSQLLVMPMVNLMNGLSFNSGLFSGSFMMAMASLVGHLVFGSVVGAIYKPEVQTVVA